jgi:hypothetical protein
MIVEEELEQLRQEKKSLQVALSALQAVNQRLRTNNQALREGLQEAIKAIEDLRQRETSLEGVIASRTANVSESWKADSQRTAIIAAYRLLWTASFVPLRACDKKVARNQEVKRDTPSHSLRKAPPDETFVHPVWCCEQCQADLGEAQASLVERRQVIDLLIKRIWVKEYQVEEKQCPHCFHLTRATFPDEAKGPVQYGVGIQALAT